MESRAGGGGLIEQRYGRVKQARSPRTWLSKRGGSREPGSTPALTPWGTPKASCASRGERSAHCWLTISKRDFRIHVSPTRTLATGQRMTIADRGRERIRLPSARSVPMKKALGLFIVSRLMARLMTAVKLGPRKLSSLWRHAKHPAQIGRFLYFSAICLASYHY